MLYIFSIVLPTRLEIYTVTLGSVNGQFKMNVEVRKVHKAQLLEVANPNYATLVDKYSHLKGVKIEDKGTNSDPLNLRHKLVCYH